MAFEYKQECIIFNNVFIRLGDKILRKRINKNPKWIEIEVNDTYIKLIKENPEDYKLLDNYKYFTWENFEAYLREIFNAPNRTIHVLSINDIIKENNIKIKNNKLDYTKYYTGQAMLTSSDFSPNKRNVDSKLN